MTQSGFNTKKPSKCIFSKCDWPYDTWHICIDVEGPEPVVPPKPVMTEEQRAKIGESVRAKAKKRTAERDVEIVKLYTEEQMGLKPIARKMGIAYQTVRNTLIRNNVPFRPKGVTNYRPGNVHGAFN